jgi:hypothetical protein
MTRQDRVKGLQTMRPRADGPTRANRPPTVAESAAGIDAGATRKSEFPPRVEFDNYKASYLRM